MQPKQNLSAIPAGPSYASQQRAEPNQCKCKLFEAKYSRNIVTIPRNPSGLTHIHRVRYRPFSKGLWTKVNVHSHSLGSRARGKRRSALACLLLLTIGYGAIVEAAHSHGLSPRHLSQLTAVSDNSNSQSSYQGQSHLNDCSLCQFQRQLFGTFVYVTLTVQTPQQVTFLSEETVSYLSTLALPTSGRAPPLM